MFQLNKSQQKEENMKREKKGFTLTEVIITMMLIIILSLIAMPIYRGKHSNYAKLAEGYALLGTIKDAQINYYNEYGNFLHHDHSYARNSGGSNKYTSVDPVLGINALNNQYFTWFTYTGTDGMGDGTVHQRYYYRFIVTLESKVGTIWQQYNLTQRFGINVRNVNTKLYV